MSLAKRDNTAFSASISINNSSTITTGSTVSTIGSEVGTLDETPNISFIVENQKAFHKLMEDLSIIDNVYNMFEIQYETNTYDNQILRKEMNTELKHKAIQQLIQSEVSYINELFSFEKLYTSQLKHWLDNTSAANIKNEIKSDLETLLYHIHTIAISHTHFIKQLRNRVQIWGPTQLISDVFCDMYTTLDVYESFIDQHPRFVMLFASLFKNSSFVKLLETTITEDKSYQLDSAKNVIYYLQIPLSRFSFYNKVLQKLTQYSDPTSPDYSHLSSICNKYSYLENHWSKRLQDAQSHLSVLEASLTIEGCLIGVTLERRLLQSSKLIKVDLDDITSISDVRLYLLYNDALIYCKIQKDKKKSSSNNEPKFVYKGTLNLRGAEVRQLAPSFCAKMVEVKKPLFRLGKKSNTDSSSLSDTEAFGFELVSTEVNLDAMSPMHQNYQTATASAGNPLLRRHVIRTSSRKQQKIWFEGIRDAIANANKKP